MHAKDLELQFMMRMQIETGWEILAASGDEALSDELGFDELQVWGQGVSAEASAITASGRCERDAQGECAGGCDYPDSAAATSSIEPVHWPVYPCTHVAAKAAVPHASNQGRAAPSIARRPPSRGRSSSVQLGTGEAGAVWLATGAGGSRCCQPPSPSHS